MPIYMDHSATTPVRREVLEAMLPYFSEKFGNSSSVHSFGQSAKAGLDLARQQVADLLNAGPDEIYFTSGGTESDTLALKGIAYAHREKGNHIITSSIEHPAILNTCQQLEKEGFSITYLSVDSYGMVQLSEVEKAITPKTILISVMYANNEVGTIQPVEEIARLARSKKIFFHTDAVQTSGKLGIDTRKEPIDLISISSHKIYGPKGVGALYIRKGTPIQPLVQGGGHERGIRPGTENIAGIVGFGKAAELSKKDREQENQQLIRLQKKMADGLLKGIQGIRLNGHPEKRLPGNVNVSFPDLEGEGLVLALDLNGLAVSAGSACSSKNRHASYVLRAMGLSNKEAFGAIRISLGRDNTEKDVDFAVETIRDTVRILRGQPSSP